jgi:hypothetical protein
LLLSQSSLAEFYKYRDEKGAVRYTDSPLDIPKDQQKSAATYREIPLMERSDEAPDVEDLDDIERKLSAEKEVLDQEYAVLEAEQQALEEASQAAETPEQIAALEKKIEDFNRRLQQYEAERLLFKKKADVYNEARKAEFK